MSRVAAPTLYVFSGLPATGKTTLSQRLAAQRNAVHLRIDTIEQALRELCAMDVQGEGYRLAYRIAADNLRLGMSVVADCCNPIELTRTEWTGIAHQCRARHVDIEVVCSDPQVHRARVEGRASTVAGLRLPTWDDVERREYHTWTRERIVIDTAANTIETCFDELLSRLADQ
jgi:predicted kinase